MDLTKEQILRYSRHLIMPEVGMKGQKKLSSAKVLIIGAGGLGCPLALYLGAAGIGKIGIIDFDKIDFSNLQRQIIYNTADVGKYKAEVAKEKIKAMNENVEVETYLTKLTAENALNIFKDYEVIVDGTDNFPTRYLVNDGCVLLGKPNIYGSIFRFEGQATVFYPQLGPCYRCLYPEPPPPGMVPSCAEGGVLGILPGIIGVIQAAETIKIILHQGDSLVGRLLLFNALKMKFSELKIRKDKNCSVCGTNPTITKLINYEQFCGLSRGEEKAEESKFDIEPEEAKRLLEKNKNIVLLDVRETMEYEIVHINNSTSIPLSELQFRINELDTSDEIIVYCHHGVRSLQAIQTLQKFGFKKLFNLKGGIDNWAKKIDKHMVRY